MLSNVGLERKNDEISINGKPINGLAQPRVLPAEPSTDEPSGEDTSELLNIRTEPLKDISELINYLKDSENAIRLALQDRVVVDKTVQEYIALAARTDAEHYFALAAPVARQIYGLFDYISKKAEQTGYIEILETVSKEIGDILTAAGVEIETSDSVFDTKKHKILKTVPTDDEKLDRTIANIYTDCYTFDGKVIYQSKADVYKFNQGSTQGEKNHG